MRFYTDDLCDSIDAAVFTGDEFLIPEYRKELREYMARWERQLKQYDEPV